MLPSCHLCHPSHGRTDITTAMSLNSSLIVLQSHTEYDHSVRKIRICHNLTLALTSYKACSNTSFSIWSVWCSLNLEICWHCQLIITKLRLTVGHICCGLGGLGWRSQCASLTGAQLGSWASSSNFLTPGERWVETRGAMMVKLESPGFMSGGTTSPCPHHASLTTYMILTTDTNIIHYIHSVTHIITVIK